MVLLGHTYILYNIPNYNNQLSIINLKMIFCLVVYPASPKTMNERYLMMHHKVFGLLYIHG